MTRTAAWIAAALTLALPNTAVAHQPRTAPEPAPGLEHLRHDAKIWKAQAKARARWRKMTGAERRDALQHERRADRRTYVRARAAADDPSDLGSWAPPFLMATDYEGYAIHSAMLHTGKVLMWGVQGAPRGTATYA